MKVTCVALALLAEFLIDKGGIIKESDIIFAPFPYGDSKDVKADLFVAEIVTKTESPVSKLNGEPLRTFIGIVHYLAAMMFASAPSQFVVSGLNNPSEFLMRIV